MMKFHPFLLFFALLSGVGTCVCAQTTVAQQSFEGNSSDTWAYVSTPNEYSEASGSDVWTDRTSIGSSSSGGVRITAATDGNRFFGIRDIFNAGSGSDDPTPGVEGNQIAHELAFATVDISTLTSVSVTFDYNIFAFDESSGDELGYELFVDGTSLGRIDLVEALGMGSDVSTPANGYVPFSILLPDVASSVSLIFYAFQDGGGDWAAVDNFRVSGMPMAGPCGITVFGPAVVECITESTSSGTDLFRIRIPYSGQDADASLLIEAGATTPANDVTATTTNVGDDFTAVSDGEIVLENTAGEFEEGDEVRVSLSDLGGNCNFVLDISTTENQCSNPCDINLDISGVRFYCDAFTDGNDGLVAYFPFTGGPEPDFTVSVSGGATVGGDDPAAENGGTVIVSGLIEGGFYQVTFGGGGCATEMFTVPVPTGLCSPPALVINEVLADPTNSSDPTANDTNGNGAVNSGDEFVEIINVTDTDIDVSGYTVGDDTGPRYTFPVGTIIPAFSGFVVIGDPVGNSLSCATNATLLGTGTGFIGLSNAGDIIDLRTSSGVLVHNMSYGSEGGLGESLALNPDGNIAGGYVLHTTIATNPVNSSPCEENPNAGVSLPVELLSFNAEAAPKQVNLTWITTNEVANDRFEVQRSLDGQDWSTIGEVAAAPHTGRSTENTYRFSDQAPLVGDNYYRLAQIDLDGTRTLYGPVRAYFSSRVGLGLYPNPVTNTLNLTQLLEVTDRLQLLGADGRLLRELPVASAAIEVADLQPGVYLLRVEGAVEVSVLRFVKQ